jgi:regulatory protein
MGKQITDIKSQAKNRRRVNVYLDGQYGFSLGLEVAASVGRGDSLSDEDIEKLQARDAEEIAHDKCLKFLAYRPRSTGEVRRYLHEKGVSAEITGLVTGRLERVGLLDDRAFARYWVENRETFRARGRRLLRQELREKGIDEELVAEVLAGVDEESSAFQAALSKAPRYAGLDDEIFRAKMSGFLRRRGFDYELVRETVSRVLLQRGEEGPGDG